MFRFRLTDDYGIAVSGFARVTAAPVDEVAHPGEDQERDHHDRRDEQRLVPEPSSCSATANVADTVPDSVPVR
jgi:hypothetical protein